MGWGDGTYWLIIGLLGQAAFFGRFLVQWIASERAGRSIVPIPFWYLSLAGSSVLLAYAIHREDPIFVLGQSLGFLVYVRNITLLKRNENPASESAASAEVVA